MAELEPPTSTPDPLASLHKMSTTAGIVAADYVAISNLAIGSAVLGVATALSLISPYLCAVGAAGVLLGIIALWKISTSNGTQTGRAIAIAGIVLSLVFIAAGIVRAVTLEHAMDAEKRAIDTQIEKLGQAIGARDYAAAYALFDPEWQQIIGANIFARRLELLQTNFGKIDHIQPNRRYGFFQSGGERIAESRMMMHYAKSPDDVSSGVWLREQSDGRWLIVFWELFGVNPMEKRPAKSATSTPAPR